MTGDNGRIARNAMALYFRMGLTTLVSLYTSRVVLHALGASDFGLYGLVGGVVVLMGFLNTAMVSSTQRFLNFERVERDADGLRRVFATSLLIHLILAAIILVATEAVGLWLLDGRLNIPPDRTGAAVWVFQCATASFVIGTITSPFTAAIVANERMTAFAYTGLLDAGLKLLAAILLQITAADRLKTYATWTLGASALLALVYILFARRSFPECRVRPGRDPAIFRQMLSFASWSVASNLSVILRIQGTNILLNLFFGTLINAAMGIATQVNAAIQRFAANFIQALNPQIVRNYAARDLGQMHRLIRAGCRMSFFLLLLFALPALVETEAILGLWLRAVPDHSAAFVRLILVQSLVESFATVLAVAQGATGNVRRYHLTLSSIGLLNLPVSWLLLKSGALPYVVLMVAILFSSVIGVVRLLFLRRSIHLSLRLFATRVVLRCAAGAVLAAIAPLAMHFLLAPGLWNSIATCAVASLSVAVAAVAVGASGSERRAILGAVARRLRNIRARGAHPEPTA